MRKILVALAVTISTLAGGVGVASAVGDLGGGGGSRACSSSAWTHRPSCRTIRTYPRISPDALRNAFYNGGNGYTR